MESQTQNIRKSVSQMFKYVVAYPLKFLIWIAFLLQENNEILSQYARGEKETTADNAMNRDEYLRYQAEMEATKQTKESVCNFYTHS